MSYYNLFLSFNFIRIKKPLIYFLLQLNLVNLSQTDFLLIYILNIKYVTSNSSNSV
jgi:hypothetical protein